MRNQEFWRFGLKIENREIEKGKIAWRKEQG
jgi:hypothetical protein